MRGAGWSDTPTLLKSLIMFAWAVMVCFAISLAAGLAGSGRDLFDRYIGTYVWVPYLWVAGLPWWNAGSPADRRSLLRFANWTLWLAVVVGVVDLIQSGWSGREAGYTRDASPWRFVAYWAVSAFWLLVLRRRSVRAWAEAGKGSDVDPTNTVERAGGRTRG